MRPQNPSPSLVTVQGVIVRVNATTNTDDDYVVVWSKRFNHSVIYKGDISTEMLNKIVLTLWVQYDVDMSKHLGPEDIQLRAFNLTERLSSTSEDPSIKPIPAPGSLANLSKTSSRYFTSGRHTIKFKDTFKVCPYKQDSEDNRITQQYSCLAVTGTFIPLARLETGDYDYLTRNGIAEFEGIIELDQVADSSHRCPWLVTDWVYAGEVCPLIDYVSKVSEARQTNLSNSSNGSKFNKKKPSMIANTCFSFSSAYDTSSQRALQDTQTNQYRAAIRSSVMHLGVASSVAARTIDVKPLDHCLRRVRNNTKSPLQEESLNHRPPTPTYELYGIVVAVNDQAGWFLFSKEHGCYVNLDCRLNLQLGAWYRLGLSSPPNKTELIEATRVVSGDTSPTSPPPSQHLYTRFLPSRTNKYCGHTLIATRMTLNKVDNNDFVFESEDLGFVSDRDGVVTGQYIVPMSREEIQKSVFVLEVLASANGWNIVRYHGTDQRIVLYRLANPWIHYHIDCMEDADAWRVKEEARLAAEEERRLADEEFRRREERDREEAIKRFAEMNKQAEAKHQLEVNRVWRQRESDAFGFKKAKAEWLRNCKNPPSGQK